MKVLLFPIDRPEPFGLVMTEAMACGTPVVARPNGAAPEVIVDGVTGFLADSRQGLVDAVKVVPRLDRAMCRRHVEGLFSADAMVQRYQDLYRRYLPEARRTSSRDNGDGMLPRSSAAASKVP